ncbi:MAG TPA: hypothetical protein VFG52_02715, partial [Xanthomonadales bacterium]|nr:hypothetical protein [Xanthomonadales bacterium]
MSPFPRFIGRIGRGEATLRICLLAVSIILASPAALAALPNEPGSYDGLFVLEDAVTQVATLKHHGEALAWRNLEDSGAPDPNITEHYQGLSRYPSPADRPVFYVSQSHDDGGYITVVEFGSRGSDGERLRSNLQQVGNDTEEAMPPSSDKWIRSIRLDGSFSAGGVTLPGYFHPGGSAVIDGFLLVPADQPLDDSSPTGVIIVFDLSNPLDPQPARFQPLAHGIDNLAVTKRANGSYVIWTNGDGGNDIHIYTTAPGANLGTAALTLAHVWDDSTELTGQSWPTGTGAHQSSTFLLEPDGELYLLGMRHPGGAPFAGSDYIDLYRVTDTLPSGFSLQFLGDRNLFCVYDGGGGLADMRICNMAAASGTYVSPTGELILYSMPHDDEDGFDIDSARRAEFRHRDVLRPNNRLLSATPDAGGPYTTQEGGNVQLNGAVPELSPPAFIELYDDTGWSDRSIVVDYQDRALLELNNFNNLDGFNDKASSIRWRLPLGVTALLREDDSYAGDNFPLLANGTLQTISDLGSAGFGDKTSSLQIVGSPTGGDAMVDWDLDDDGVFGETGMSATRGAETGISPVFFTNGLDGPVTYDVLMR